MFMLFESLVEIKIEIESRLYCIDIYGDDCMWIWIMTRVLEDSVCTLFTWTSADP